MFPYFRHMRFSNFARRRYGNRLKSFLATEAAALASTASVLNVSIAHTSDVDASNTGTIGTNPSNGETVTIGANVYTFKSALTEAKATAVLTSSANYANAETVTLGGRTYTFKTALTEVKATGVLTSSANYADGETVTIGSKVYTMQATLTNVDGHVKIGASEAATIANLHHAINASGGTVGTDYATATTANTQVTAVDNAAHTVTVTAIVVGTAANAIATTETSATASWGAVTLAGGVASVAGEIFIGGNEAATMTNLANGVKASGGTVGTDYATANTADPVFTAASDGSHAVTFTALVIGTASNVATTETSATASFGGALATGGVNSVRGEIKIGVAATNSRDNLVHGVNKAAGTIGTDYATANVADPVVTLTTSSTTAFVVTNKTVGAAGNGVAVACSTAHITFNPAAASATAVLTSSANYADGETVTVGPFTYVFQSTLTDQPGHVKIGASEAATMTNLARAVTGSGGTVGTDYAHNSTSGEFTAASDGSHAVTFTARVAGTLANSYVTKETSATAAFGGTKATGGLDQVLAGGVAETWSVLTAAAHGLTEDEGPYKVTAATTLPTGYTALTPVYIHVVDANTVTLKPQRNSPLTVNLGGVGVGQQHLVKLTTNAAIFELLRANTSDAIAKATDIDTLK